MLSNRFIINNKIVINGFLNAKTYAHTHGKILNKNINISNKNNIFNIKNNKHQLNDEKNFNQFYQSDKMIG